MHQQPQQQPHSQQPAPPPESPQQLAANDAAAFSVQRVYKEQHPHSPEADRPMGPSRSVAGGAMGSAGGDGPEDFFDDKGLEALINEAPDVKPGDGGVASSSDAGPTAEEILARVLPTVSSD